MSRLARWLAAACTAAAFLAAPALGAQESAKQNGGAQDTGLNARDAFWSAADLVGKHPQTADHAKPAEHASSRQHIAVKAPLGLRYSVLKRRADGTYEEVSPDAEFHAGDAIRMNLMSNQTGYLYIIEHGSSGKWRPLYPPPGVTETKLTPGQEYIIPGEGWFRFDSGAGQEKLFVLLSREPEKNLDETIASLKERQGDSLNNELVAKLQGEVQSRDLVFTTAEDSPTSSTQADKATYVVNKASNKTNDPHIVVDVVLSHK